MIGAQFLLGSIPYLIQLYANKYFQDDLAKTMVEFESELNVPKTKIYDFIIVGGGTAGCVLAGRLSESYNVLLLEAGGEPPPAVDVPFFAPMVQKDPTINYFFKPLSNPSGSPETVDTKIGVKLENKSVTTGKMLGGSGSHNGMLHNRGNSHDFDNWSYLVNDTSWNYSNVLKYFKKSEHFVGHLYGPKADDIFYGKSGPINVERDDNDLLDSWQRAGEELGFRANDPNEFQTESFTPFNVAIRNGRRSSSYTEYVRPFENTRKNLTVLKYANVSEILLDEQNRAYGIAYSRHNFPQIAHALKEVIISAGAFSSPLLLMKSGIGPAAILRAAKIPIRVSIESVGHNLNEHPAINPLDFSVNDTTLFRQLHSNQTQIILQDFQDGKGLLSTRCMGAQAFKVSKKSERNDWPDLQISFSAPVIIDNIPATANFSAVVGLPKSRGIISLDTEKYLRGVRDDTQLALIDYRLLSHPDDIEVLLEGIKTIFDIAEKTKAFQHLNMAYDDEPLSMCSDHMFKSDDYWRCYIRHRVISWQHTVGTCSMGPELGDTNSSVVDNKFRVRGVSNLRVVDASVIPSVPNANINAVVIMLAEKAADEIKKYWDTVSNNSSN